MKKIENKTVLICGSTEMTYSDLIKSTLKQVDPKQGITYEDISKRNRIDNSVNNIKENIIEIEDADYDNLLHLCLNMKWAFFEIEFKNFVDYIKSCK